MKEVTYNSSLLKDSWNSNETVKPNNFNELSGAVKNVIANANDLAHNYLQQGKQYVVGDIVYSKNLNKGRYLLCTQGGATGDSEPQLINKNVGETVTDGTVVWTVQKVGNAQLNSSNTFTALNTFRANIAVSNGTAAGSQGQVIFGVKPSTATVQANIIAPTTGALNYIATESTGHYFKIGNNTASTSITTNESETAILSHNTFEFARITNVGVAKWLGNANTATKLETSRTINGVAFDGTKDIIVDSNPVGTIIAVAYTGVPEGYMHCNGAAVNRTTYVNLFNKIGTTYGAGDGSTTFNLPNTVARFLEGGAGAGTYYEAGLPNITGNISAFKASISGAFVGSNNTNRYDGWNDNEDEYAVSTSFDASRSNSIYGASTTVQPPAMTVIYCIKY